MKRLALVAVVLVLSASEGRTDKEELFKTWGKQFIKVDGQFYRLPPISWKVASSRTLGLPFLGEFGSFESWIVLRVAKDTPDAMIVVHPADKRKQQYPVRLKGYLNQKITDGQAWPPVGEAKNMVVIGTWDDGETNRRIGLAVPLETARKGLTAEQFAELLEKDKPDFQKIAEELKVEHEKLAKRLLGTVTGTFGMSPALIKLYLQSIVEDHPGTEAAKQAAGMLKRFK